MPLNVYIQMYIMHSANIRYVCRVGFRPPQMVGESLPYAMLFHALCIEKEIRYENNIIHRFQKKSVQLHH
jgi:hypothetical protein